MSPKTYRILVTGPRDAGEEKYVQGIIACAISRAPQGTPVVLVHGNCPTGVDYYADTWGRAMSGLLDVTVECHPAQGHPTQDFGPWPGAGPRRNQFMVSLGADVCLAFISPCTRPNCKRPKPHDSHGTASCIRYAEQAGIRVERYPL